jgi:hypothetical protein
MGACVTAPVCISVMIGTVIDLASEIDKASELLYFLPPGEWGMVDRYRHMQRMMVMLPPLANSSTLQSRHSSVFN